MHGTNDLPQVDRIGNQAVGYPPRGGHVVFGKHGFDRLFVRHGLQGEDGGQRKERNLLQDQADEAPPQTAPFFDGKSRTGRGGQSPFSCTWAASANASLGSRKGRPSPPLVMHPAANRPAAKAPRAVSS